MSMVLAIGRQRTEFKVSQGYLKITTKKKKKDFIKPKTNNYVNSLNADLHEVNK